jgi:hypothetical protein
METMSFLVETPWRSLPGMGVGLFGLITLANGLFGNHGMFRRGIGMLARIEGWRLSVLGLALTGLGVAWVWDSKLFLFLSLGIGFTEIREASAVISAIKREKPQDSAGRPGDSSAKTRYSPFSSSSPREACPSRADAR